MVSIPFREDLHSDKQCGNHTQVVLLRVSIPFREDLHSDANTVRALIANGASFHPFQGRPPFGQQTRLRQKSVSRQQVSIPFREDLHSDKDFRKILEKAKSMFPSLSGKTSIRTLVWDDSPHLVEKKFPSLSGKTSIRTLHI